MNPIKIALIIAGSALLLALGFAGFMTFRDHQRAAQVVELQNQVAMRDVTIVVQEGIYSKMSLQMNDIKWELSDAREENKSLRKELDKRGAQVLAATNLIVKLRKELDHRSDPVIIVDPTKPSMKTVKIDSREDFDPFRVEGEVVVACDSNTAVVGLKLHQTRPLLLSVVVSQDKDGTWRTSTTSSENNMEVDIALAAVNPYMLDEKWYEKISLGVELGVGTNPGLLAGIGADVEIGRFEVGPRVWAVLDRGASAYFGASLSWHPFKKIK